MRKRVPLALAALGTRTDGYSDLQLLDGLESYRISVKARRLNPVDSRVGTKL